MLKVGSCAKCFARNTVSNNQLLTTNYKPKNVSRETFCTLNPKKTLFFLYIGFQMFRAKHFTQTQFFKKCFALNILHTKPQKTLIFPTPRFLDVSRETFYKEFGNKIRQRIRQK